MSKALQGRARRAAQAVLVLLAAGTLAVPPLIVASSGFASYRTAIRITALYALTLVFLNVVTGSFRPLLSRVFKPRPLFRAHNITGAAGFSVALTHGILIAVYGAWPGFTKLGPVTIYILAVTTSTALARRFLKKGWRVIHRLNYAVFVVAVVHAFQVGSDLKDGGTALKAIIAAYACVAAAGLAYRLEEAARRFAKKRKAAKGAAAENPS